MVSLLQDVRYGWRVLMKNPGFTAIAVICLGLGIGANTAIFSVVDTVVLRPLSLAEPERVAVVWQAAPVDGIDQMPLCVPDFLEFQTQSASFDRMALYRETDVNVTLATEPVQALAIRGSADLSALFGVNALHGRVLSPSDCSVGADPVVVLDHEFWMSRFGSDPQAIGRDLRIDGAMHTIVGVMPKGFAHPMVNKAKLWLPLALHPDMPMYGRMEHGFVGLSRLAPGVSLASAEADLDRIMATMQSEYPPAISDIDVMLESLHDNVVGGVRPGLLVTFGAVAFVLLIACVNVLNLLLARCSGRQQELSVRLALGAQRGHVLRLMLAESVLLTMVGAAVGVVLAGWLLDAIVRFGPEDVPRLGQVAMDWRVLGFTLVVALLVGVMFGVLASLRSTSRDPMRALQQGGSRGAAHGRDRLRSCLVVAEVAMSLVLLVGAGLMVRSFLAIQQIDPGLRPEGVLTATINLPESKYPTPGDVDAYSASLLDRLGNRPEVIAAGHTTQLPMTGGGWVKMFTRRDVPVGPNDAIHTIGYRIISQGYVEAMGLRLQAGRTFEHGDVWGATPVAIINESARRQYFPDVDPLGLIIRSGPPDGVLDELPPGVDIERVMPWRTIVGVVADVRGVDVTAESEALMYVPSTQQDANVLSFALAVRTAGDPGALVKLVHDTVGDLDPEQPIAEAATMLDVADDAIAASRFNTILLVALGGLALVLAIVGLYGVLSFSVLRRTREIGLRVAVGADARQVLWMVIGQGLRLTAVGVAIGIVAALALTRVMESLLFQVSAIDPLTYVVIVASMFAASIVACYVPARRATRVDPMIALRCE